MSRALAFQKSVFGDHFGETENHCVGGHCSCCGGCCSDIFPVTKKELDTLRKFVRSHHYKPHTQLKMGMTATYDMTCPFLNEEKKCDIYDIRPETH
jgi:Fe-S-cluster containining protein